MSVLYVLQADYGYGHGWEDLIAAEASAEVHGFLRDYQENEGGCYRIVRRRERAEQ